MSDVRAAFLLPEVVNIFILMPTKASSHSERLVNPYGLPDFWRWR
jgi:hypothetical protein